MKFKKVVMAGVLAATAIFGSFGLSACSRDTVTIRVFNWGDFIDPVVLEMFTEETGIRITYTTYDSNETMYARIQNTSFDVLFPSDFMISRLIEEDLLQELNFDNIPNFVNIGDRFRGLAYDPYDRFSVVYKWGTVGILYNTTMVSEPITSWASMFDPQYAGQIFMYDSMRDSFVVALRMLGYSINTTNINELHAARDLLISQRPLVLAYVGDDVKDRMIGGEAALALVYSGDALFAQRYNPDLNYVIPIEGSNVWYDAMVIPRNARNVTEAEMFINFMLRPDIAAMNVAYVGFTTANEAALRLIDPVIANNPIFWPSDEEYYRCEVFVHLGDFTREFDRAFTEVMASR
ncbi:MAG: spermidine/putrescine ABC transporter substrate-binding protein [Defluviitaleaceae bacterium]|nr:spermidine/putrescine ABC transporter substrate-binding protein [Defluviitaleaceae bacterium]